MFRLFIIALCLLSSVDGDVCRVRNTITKAALESGSDEVIILREGKPIYYFKSPSAPERYDLGQMTGMFLSFAVGSLIEEGKLPCLDIPVYHYFPNFPCDVQIRALLNHTSGLSKNEDIYTLSAIIAKISGKSTQEYIAKIIFAPLEISDYTWVTEKGDSRLMLTAKDLAKVGMMLADDGQYNCKQIISPYWMSLLKKPSQDKNPFFGQQIWLEYCDLEIYWDDAILDYYWNQGMNLNVIQKLASLNGRVVNFGGSAVQGNILRLWSRELTPDKYNIIDLIRESYFTDLPLGHFTPGSIKSIISWGPHGQQMIVMPREKFVGIRLSERSSDIFTDFVYYVDLLSKEFAGWID